MWVGPRVSMLVFAMVESDVSYRGCPHVAHPLIEHDLCARLAPLDRYGLPGFSAALVDGLLVVASRSKSALRALGSCNVK